MTRENEVWVGTSGWMYRHWRGAVYPPDLPGARWLAHYAREFDTVEINNSFYRLPSPETFDAWAGQVPRDFRFAVKASRFLTHMKKLKDPVAPLANILGHARALGPKLGPVLYQLPPRWRADVGRLREFLALLPGDVDHVLEFRDPSWYVPAVCDALAEFRVGFCQHDLRGEPTPDWVTGRVVYVRFHGPTGRAYAGRYDLNHLRSWARRVRGLPGDVYVYFNNDEAGHAVANARELRSLLGLDPRREATDALRDTTPSSPAPRVRPRAG
jgi:uncharacterized protein YecE (DUF72 family)